MTEHAQEIAALADEYVVGLLSPSEAALFEALLDRDTDLARRVGALRDRMLPLDLSATPVPVPPGFARRVRDSLPPQDARATVAAPEPTLPPAANRPWAPALIAASLFGVAVGFGGAALRPPSAPTVVAVLVDDAGVPQAVIDDYGNDTANVRFVADIPVPADRTLQVWTLPSPEMGPTSLGVLDRAGPTVLHFDDLPAPGERQLYEVTLEPLGGSPTGRPTGPIIGKGFAASQT